MDRDEIAENIARAQIRWHRSGCGYPDRGCSCAVLDEGDRQMAAQVSVADYRERFPQIAEQWTGEAQEVRAAHAEQMASCDDCRDFGTICRPCRQRRYEAAQPQRSGLRFRIITSVSLGLALLIAGLFLQAKWDAECAAEQPGTRWNGDTWLCEAAR